MNQGLVPYRFPFLRKRSKVKECCTIKHFFNLIWGKLGYFNEAPFTKGLPKESPDRLGQYIGWKMVRKYMEQHSDLPLEKLLNVPFAQIMQAYKID